MYSYRPTGAHLPQPAVRQLRAIRPLIGISLLVALIVGLIGIRIGGNYVYARGSQNLPTSREVILPAYAKRISSQTDVKKLAATGEKLLQKNMPGYAVLNFQRASELDINYRDAAYGWAYALLTDKQSHLSEEDRQALHTAIDRAEAVDPLYVPLLKLKLLVATMENDQATINATQTRLSLLEDK